MSWHHVSTYSHPQRQCCNLRMSDQHANMATFFATSLGPGWTAGMRTRDLCSSVARTRCRCFPVVFSFFSVLDCCICRTWNFCKNVLLFFFVNDAVIIKHLTGVNFNICCWFWSSCLCVFIWDRKPVKTPQWTEAHLMLKNLHLISVFQFVHLILLHEILHDHKTWCILVDLLHFIPFLAQIQLHLQNSVDNNLITWFDINCQRLPGGVLSFQTFHGKRSEQFSITVGTTHNYSH